MTEKAKWAECLQEARGDVDEAVILFDRWKVLTDLYFLGAVVFGLDKAYRYNRYSRKSRPVLDPVFHKWLARALAFDDDKIIIVPRRHLKTTWVKYKMIQKLLADPTFRQAYYTINAAKAASVLRDVKRMLENEYLQRLFPDVLVPKNQWQKDTENLLTVWREPGGETRGEGEQISVYGVGQSVTGTHPDEHYYDDLIDKETVRTIERMQKTLEWYQYIQAVLEPDGIETYTGTPYHYADLSHWIIENEIYPHVFRRKCIENNKPIYRFYTLQDYERIKKRQGNYIFSAQFLCDAEPIEDKIFPPPQPTYGELPEGVQYYIAVDPAGTTNVWSDETAIVVAGITKEGAVYVVEAFGVKKKGNDIARILLELNERYAPRSIGIEFGVMQHLREVIDHVKSAWESGQRKRIHLPIEEVKLEKRSKYDRVNLTVGSFIRMQRLFINPRCTDLINQMDRFTPNYSGKDDLVDALSMIFQMAHQFTYRWWEKPIAKIAKDWFTFEELMKKKPARPTRQEKVEV